ncbi:hypothetical protein EDB89DRAFT_1913863 [Lactarius sanguifluus]|nr:hypothetical protein EDB89DRAFT_1913863 [Lactarius sanguifluus]
MKSSTWETTTSGSHLTSSQAKLESESDVRRGKVIKLKLRRISDPGSILQLIERDSRANAWCPRDLCRPRALWSNLTTPLPSWHHPNHPPQRYTPLPPHCTQPPHCLHLSLPTAILGAVADEPYTPTPTEHPLPTNPESLNNSTLVPSQMPLGMERIVPTQEGQVASVDPSPSPEQIATVGAALLAQLRALESQSYHPSQVSNPLDHADDPEYLDTLGRLLDAPAGVAQEVLPTLEPASQRLTTALRALFTERAAHRHEASNPTTYSSPSHSYIKAFLAAHMSPDPSPAGSFHLPPSIMDSQEDAIEAERLLEDWLAHEVNLPKAIVDKNAVDFSANAGDHFISIMALTCWIHASPIERVDAFVHRTFPSIQLLGRLQAAFYTCLACLHNQPEWHLPYAERVAAYLARRLTPADPASLERAREGTTQEMLRAAAPTPVLTASPSHITISEDSVEVLSARDFQGPIRTPSQSSRYHPISCRPSVSSLTGAAPGPPSDHSDTSSSDDSTTLVASPASMNFRGRPIPRDLRSATLAPEGNAANPVLVDTPSVFWADGSQTQWAKATMDELRELASIPRFPHEVLNGLPGSPNVEMRDMAGLLHPQRIGYSFYLQGGNLSPLKEGLQIGTDVELNAAFHSVAATLSAGLDCPSNPHLWVLGSADWFRAATIVVLGKFGLVRFGPVLAKPETEPFNFHQTEPKPNPNCSKPFQTIPNHFKPIKKTILRGILTSNNFYTQGDFSLSPCPDEFQLADGLPLPLSQRGLLQEVTAQMQAELAALGDARVNRAELWEATRAKERAVIEQAVRDELAPQVDEWKKGMWAGLRSLAVDDGFAYLIDQIMAEGLEKEVAVAGAMQAEYQLYKQSWEHDHADRLRELHAEWDAQALKEQKAAHEAEVAAQWRAWKETELAEAKKQALAKITLEDVIRECGSDASLLIKEKCRFAEEYVRAKYQDWVAEEQSRIWPEVEWLAQLTTREDYLWEERERIYPGVRAEIRADAEAYRAKLVRAQQLKEERAVQEEQHLAALKKKAGGKCKATKSPSPMDTREDGVAGEAPKALVEYEGSQLSTTSQQSASLAPPLDQPTEATPPQVGPRENSANGVASSMHCPTNAMEDDPSPPQASKAPVPAPPAPITAPAAADPLLVQIAQMLTSLTTSVSSLASRVDTIEGQKSEFTPPLPAVVPTRPSVAPAAPKKAVAATSATKPQPPKAKAGSIPAPQEGPSPIPEALTPPPASDEFPPLANATPQATRATGTAKAMGTAPAPALPAKPAATPLSSPDDGFIHVGQRGRPAYSTATAKGISSHDATTAKAKVVAVAQGRTPAGNHARGPPPSSPAKANTTKVVVIRHGGFADKTQEEKLRHLNPGAIVSKTAKPICLLYSHWSREAARTGNFVYIFAGKLPMLTILPYSQWLCEPFPGAMLVPSEGWFWAQLRGVVTTDCDTGEIWDEDQLTAELHLHPAFETVPFIVKPHWLTHPANLRDATATIGFTLEDPTGAVVQAAMAGPISMFSYQVKFIPCGDTPTLIQCGRCHVLGHRTNNKSCKWHADQIRCQKCGWDHHIDDHNFECTGTHAKPGICLCKFKCLLCGELGHNTRSRKCAKRGDFPAPRLATIKGRTPAAPAPVLPQKAKGKAPQRVDDDDAPLTDDEMRAGRESDTLAASLPSYVDWGAEPIAGGWGEASDTAKPGEMSTDRAMARQSALHAAGPTPIPAKSYNAADLQGLHCWRCEAESTLTGRDDPSPVDPDPLHRRDPRCPLPDGRSGCTGLGARPLPK